MKDKINRVAKFLAMMAGLVCLSAVQAKDTTMFKGYLGQPIISFYQTHGMVEGISIHTNIEIFADGNVVVKVPEYMEDAGEWRYQMSPKKLQAVVKMLDGYGVMVFDSKVVAQRKTAIQRSAEIRYAVMDATTSTFVFNFSHYGTESDKDKPLAHSVEWPQVNVDAERFPQLIELSSLARAEKLMMSLTQHQRYGGVRVSRGQ